MMLHSLLPFALLWASCMARLAPSAIPPSLDTDTPRTSSPSDLAPGLPSAPETASSLPSDLIVWTEPSALDKRQSKAFFVRCFEGFLSSCTILYDTYCNNAGTLLTDNPACRRYCTCVRVPQRACWREGGFANAFDCFGPTFLYSSYGNDGIAKEREHDHTPTWAADADQVEEDSPATFGCHCASDRCLGSSETTTCWLNVTHSEQNSTALKMCPFMDWPVNYNTTAAATFLPILANTTNCILMMELYFSPELPATKLVAQKLYAGRAVNIASYDDCYLFVSGGENATADVLGPNDAFVIGNYDFADGIYELISAYAASGNISTLAACGSLNECPVVDVVDWSNKTGQIGFQFCVGGAELGTLAFEI